MSELKSIIAKHQLQIFSTYGFYEMFGVSKLFFDKHIKCSVLCPFRSASLPWLGYEPCEHGRGLNHGRGHDDERRIRELMTNNGELERRLTVGHDMYFISRKPLSGCGEPRRR